MKRLLIAVVSGSLINFSIAISTPGQTQANFERIAKVKRTVNKIGSDANVNIQFVDGSTTKGRITVIGDSFFVLVNKKTADAITISFAQVKEVRRAGDNPFSDPEIWVGIAMIPAIIGLCLRARNKD